MGYQKKKDDNHNEITQWLLAIPGSRGQDVYMIPEWGADFVWYFRGRLFVIEIKDGSKPPSSRKLTINEENMKEYWGENYHVVESIEDCIKLVERRF